METDELLINTLLFVLLPLWGFSAFLDWLCHRKTKIESTSGVKENLIHSLMGIQIGTPILLCFFFKINVLVLLVCFVAWFSHEFVANWDIRVASPKRKIGYLETHIHCYLATLPLYMFIFIIVLNWDEFLKMVSFEWEGELMFLYETKPQVGEVYLQYYLLLMMIFCLFPYVEESIRCYWFWLKAKKKAT